MSSRRGEVRADLAVVGGGPAGLAAALAFARVVPGRVVVLERNDEPGRKLLITGAGRCNLTNTGVTPDAFPRGGTSAALRDLVARWPYRAVAGFFTDLGLPLLEGEDGRVFPRTERASSVLDVLRLALDEAGARLFPGHRVTGLRREGRGFTLTTEAGATVRARTVVVATGGQSFPKTGSTGDGYGLAAGLGHGLVPPTPALVPLRATLGDLHRLQGQKWRAGLTLTAGRRVLASTVGDLLFADYGLSGLGILDLTARGERRYGEGLALAMDFLPELGPGGAARELASRAARWPGRLMGELLAGLLPDKMARVLTAHALGSSAETPLAGLSAALLERTAGLLAAWTVPVRGDLGFDHAQVTAGGVPLDEVAPATFESLRAPGCFLAGEVLDLHGVSGGYNLHAAWATGLSAGAAAAAMARRGER